MEPVTLNKRPRNKDSVDLKTSNKMHWNDWVKIGEKFNITEADAGGKISQYQNCVANGKVTLWIWTISIDLPFTLPTDRQTYSRSLNCILKLKLCFAVISVYVETARAIFDRLGLRGKQALGTFGETFPDFVHWLPKTEQPVFLN